LEWDDNRPLPFGLLAFAPEINNPAGGKTKLVAIACWASFAVWTSIAGISPPRHFSARRIRV
jgi:hypothetical protein